MRAGTPLSLLQVNKVQSIVPCIQKALSACQMTFNSPLVSLLSPSPFHSIVLNYFKTWLKTNFFHDESHLIITMPPLGLFVVVM